MPSLDLIIITSHFERFKDASICLYAWVRFFRISAVCMFVNDCSNGGNPSPIPAFCPKPGRFSPLKINVCESIWAPVCVSRFCKTNLSSVRRFSAIEPGFDHSATVNNAREATAHLQHGMFVCVCTCMWQGAPLSFLQMQQGSSSTFLHLALLISCQIQEHPHWYCVFEGVRACVTACAGGFYSRQEELNSSRQLRPALWHTLTHYIEPAHSGILSLKKTIRYEGKGASLTHMDTHACRHRAGNRWTHSRLHIPRYMKRRY